MTGGSITGESTAGIAIGPETAATVTIKGGSVSGGIDDLINNSPKSVIRIFGKAESFNLPLGEVTAESGNITGQFGDGMLFDFSFFRGRGGVIELVPVAEGLPGDYNGNGIVDAADYVMWRDHLGTPEGTLPNDIDGGAIGAAQYATWRSNFGMTISSALATSHMATAPEPTSALLLALTATAAFPTRRGCAKRTSKRICC